MNKGTIVFILELRSYFLNLSKNMCALTFFQYCSNSDTHCINVLFLNGLYEQNQPWWINFRDLKKKKNPDRWILHRNKTTQIINSSFCNAIEWVLTPCHKHSMSVDIRMLPGWSLLHLQGMRWRMKVPCGCISSLFIGEWKINRLP